MRTAKVYFQRHYPESRFGGFSDIDGTIAFYSRIRSLCLPESTLLDIGCGRGEFLEDNCDYRRNLRCLKGYAGKVIGIDVDPAGADNESIDEFRKITEPEASWPIEDSSVDLAYADCVLEHIEFPREFFGRACRVLKPGGYLCIRTANVNSYVGLFSRLIPNKHHAKALEIAQEGRKEEDVFPTHYHCNTSRKVRKMLAHFGLDGVAYGYEAEPSYLSFSALAYRLGVWHQKLAPRCLKDALFVFARKPIR